MNTKIFMLILLLFVAATCAESKQRQAVQQTTYKSGIAPVSVKYENLDSLSNTIEREQLSWMFGHKNCRTLDEYYKDGGAYYRNDPVFYNKIRRRSELFKQFFDRGISIDTIFIVERYNFFNPRYYIVAWDNKKILGVSGDNKNKIDKHNTQTTGYDDCDTLEYYEKERNFLTKVVSKWYSQKIDDIIEANGPQLDSSGDFVATRIIADERNKIARIDQMSFSQDIMRLPVR